MLLQETKLCSMSDLIVKELWGNKSCDWVCLEATGSAGGILICWDERSFSTRDKWLGVFSASIILEDATGNSSWLVTSVYGPMDRRLGRSFWNELDSIRSKWNGPWCLGGDWNVVRFSSLKINGS